MVRAQQRTDVVSYTLLAEMSYFHQQRVRDFNEVTKIFLQEQITYYQKVLYEVNDYVKQVLLDRSNFLILLVITDCRPSTIHLVAV